MRWYQAGVSWKGRQGWRLHESGETLSHTRKRAIRNVSVRAAQQIVMSEDLSRAHVPTIDYPS